MIFFSSSRAAPIRIWILVSKARRLRAFKTKTREREFNFHRCWRLCEATWDVKAKNCFVYALAFLPTRYPIFSPFSSRWWLWSLWHGMTSGFFGMATIVSHPVECYRYLSSKQKLERERENFRNESPIDADVKGSQCSIIKENWISCWGYFKFSITNFTTSAFPSHPFHWRKKIFFHLENMATSEEEGHQHQRYAACRLDEL